MKVATFKTDITIQNYNIKTRSGRKSPKNKAVKAGDVYVIHEEFTSTGMATYGNKCFWLRDGTRFLAVESADVHTHEVKDAPFKNEYRIRMPNGNFLNAGTDKDSWFTIEEARKIKESNPDYTILLWGEIETL